MANLGKKMELSMWKKEYMFQAIEEYKSRFYKKITTLQMLDIQDNNRCSS